MDIAVILSEESRGFSARFAAEGPAFVLAPGTTSVALPYAHSPCRISGSFAPEAVTPSMSSSLDPIIQST